MSSALDLSEEKQVACGWRRGTPRRSCLCGTSRSARHRTALPVSLTTRWMENICRPRGRRRACARFLCNSNRLPEGLPPLAAADRMPVRPREPWCFVVTTFLLALTSARRIDNMPLWGCHFAVQQGRAQPAAGAAAPQATAESRAAECAAECAVFPFPARVPCRGGDGRRRRDAAWRGIRQEGKHRSGACRPACPNQAATAVEPSLCLHPLFGGSAAFPRHGIRSRKQRSKLRSTDHGSAQMAERRKAGMPSHPAAGRRFRLAPGRRRRR